MKTKDITKHLDHFSDEIHEMIAKILADRGECTAVEKNASGDCMGWGV